MALEDSQKLNDYVAPLQWQEIATDIEKLKDAVYNHTTIILEDYIKFWFNSRNCFYWQ